MVDPIPMVDPISAHMEEPIPMVDSIYKVDPITLHT